MTTEKQIAANRQNAKYSTGPRTEHGKRRSRRNAIRHGLTAETVIAVLEDATDYKAFERAIKADYQLQSSIECELVNRLVSLLWRLRRAIKVESGLISIQTAILHDDQHVCSRPNIEPIVDRLSIFPTLVPSRDLENSAFVERLSSKDPEADRSEKTQKLNTDHADIARSFLQLANLDSGIFERLIPNRVTRDPSATLRPVCNARPGV